MVMRPALMEKSPEERQAILARVVEKPRRERQTRLVEHGLDAPPMLEPADVVADLLSVLGEKPVHISPYLGNDEQMAEIEKQRYEQLLFMEEATKAFYG